MAWNQEYSDQEKLQSSMLRAIEWGIWPAFLSQPIVPVLLLFFQWWQAIGVFILLTMLWSFVRYRYVSVAMARFGAFFVLLKWLTVPTAVIHLVIQRNYALAVLALLWPIFFAPYLGLFIGGTKVGKIETMFAVQLGSSDKPPKSGVDEETHQCARQDHKDMAASDRGAAGQGNTQAQYNLGNLYDEGRGVPKDHAQAALWYRKAAEQGHVASQFMLGDLYRQGQGVPKDHSQAAFWYWKAAKQGFAPAQYNLGILHSNGRGVPQDYVQAAAWYRKAAEQGEPKAQRDLGVLYGNGHGVPQDYAQSAFWRHKAAEQGNAQAQLDLAALYESGQGVAQDYAEAYFWSYIAAAGELYPPLKELASKTRHKAALNLTAADESRIQQKARMWLGTHGAKLQ